VKDEKSRDNERDELTSGRGGESRQETMRCLVTMNNMTNQPSTNQQHHDMVYCNMHLSLQ